MTEPSLREEHNDKSDAVQLRLPASYLSDSELTLRIHLALADAWAEIDTTPHEVLKEVWRFRYAFKGGDLMLALRGLLSPLRKRSFHEPLRPVSTARGTAGLQLGEHTPVEPREAGYAIYTRGDESQPQWVLRSNGHEPLVGAIQGDLATLEIVMRPHSVRARFTTSAAMISIEEVDGLLFSQLPQNKRIVIRQLMVKFVYEKLAADYLSEVTLTSA